MPSNPETKGATFRAGVSKGRGWSIGHPKCSRVEMADNRGDHRSGRSTHPSSPLPLCIHVHSDVEREGIRGKRMLCKGNTSGFIRGSRDGRDREL